MAKEIKDRLYLWCAIKKDDDGNITSNSDLRVMCAKNDRDALTRAARMTTDDDEEIIIRPFE